MTPDQLNRLWLLATGLLILIIITSSVVILTQRHDGKLLAIIPPQNTPYSGQIYIGGAVNRPGAYDFGPDDSLGSLIEASGGVQADADLAALQLYIPTNSISTDFQKIDINRAEVWLLLALPGIGEIKSQAIVDYRQKIGHFKNIEQLIEVPGITRSVFEKIKDLITIAD